MANRILIVEDSPTQAEKLERDLLKAGFVVVVENDGEAGLETALDSTFDIIISDIVMPGSIDGYELCRRYKRGGGDTPVILLTSLSDPLDIIHGLECGADNFFTKPVDRDHLLERIRMLLVTRSVRRRARITTGVKVYFGGREFTITSEREQILDLLMTSFEEAVHQNRVLLRREEELSAARSELAVYARSLEARLERILQSVPDALFSVDPAWRDVHYISPGSRHVFACNPEQFSIDYWRENIHADDRTRAENMRREAVEKQSRRTFEYQFHVNGGPPRWILETVIPVQHDGVVDRVDGVARDVTDQREVQRQLELSDTILRNVGNIVVVADEQGAIRHVPPSVHDLTGYTPDELLDDGFWTRLHGEGASEIRSKVAAIARGQAQPARQTWEATLRHRDGSDRTFLWTAVPGPGGLAIGVGADITDRKQAEEAVQRLASFPEQNPHIVIEFDSTGHVIYVNHAAGTQFRDLSERGLDHPFLAGLDALLSQSAAKGPLQDEVTTDGRSYERMVYRVRGTDTFRLFATDVTTLRRQTRFLELLQVITASSNEATDFEQDLRLTVHEVCRRTGWPVGHVYLQAQRPDEGMVPTDIWHLDDADRLARFREITMATSFGVGEGMPGRVLASGEPEWIEDLAGDPTFLRTDAGSPVGVASGFAVPVFVGGEPVAVLEFYQDRPHPRDQELLDVMAQIGLRLGRVLERQRAEEQQRATEEQVRQAQKMEAVGRLAGGVAHDFNNLLTVILGEADLLLSTGRIPDHVRESLEDIRKAGKRASAVTRQLLSFSRRQSVETTVFDPNDLLADLQKMLRRLIGEDVEFAVRLTPEVGRVRADRGQIEQVIVNLVVNARDAMPTGGIAVIETANVTVSSDISRVFGDMTPGSYIVIAISDTGIGMTPEVKRKLFEPFFTTKPQGQGTGLGLATSYGIVRRFGGYIGAYSEEGVGTTMKVYLPHIEDRIDADTIADDTDVPAGTETILLVEDEEQVCRTAERMLVARGYTVMTAATARQALDSLADRELHVDLLLTDLVLPGASGRELAERATALRPGLKVLFASGYTNDAIQQQKLLDRGADILEKPFTREQIARRVRRALDSTRISRPAGDVGIVDESRRSAEHGHIAGKASK